MASDTYNAESMSFHTRTLGKCWVAYGFISLLAAVGLVYIANTATVMFGALLVRVADPFGMMSNFHFLYGVVIIYLIICGVLGVLAGMGLLVGQPFGRTVALVAAFLCLSSIPLGTTLGIYTLMIFLPLHAGHFSAATMDAQRPNLRGQTVTM